MECGCDSRSPTARDVGDNSRVKCAEVLTILDALDAAQVRYWVAGGWGVDALAGSQSREHRDLDLAVDAAHFNACMEVLAALGYVVETDWLPLRVEVVARGRGWVDVHPVVFDANGAGLLGDLDGVHFTYGADAFSLGEVGGRPVPCLSDFQQRLFHSGYEHRPQDKHDLAILDGLRPDRG